MPKSSAAVVSFIWAVLWVWIFTPGCEKAKPRFICSDKIGCVDVKPGDPVQIGVIEALSGKVAPLGVEQVRGLDLALDRRHGKILGHPVRLQTEDGGCSAEGGANAALKIIADPKTVAIMGTTCSAEAAGASKVMSDAGLTMISGNNSAPYLTAIGGVRGPDWQPGYFRTAPNEESSGKAAADYAYHELGIRKAATLNDGDIYTRGLADGFAKRFEALGGKIVLAASINKGDKEMQPVLTAVLNSGAQLLFFPLFQPEGNDVLLQARKTPGFETVTLMSDGSLIESSFIEAVKEDGKGLYFVGPTRPRGLEVDELAREYENRFHLPPPSSYYLSAYDAAAVLMDTLEKIAVRDRDGTLHIGRQALRDALYATREFKGVTGTLSCNAFGDCAVPAFNILRLDDPAAGLKGLQSNVLYTYTGGK